MGRPWRNITTTISTASDVERIFVDTGFWYALNDQRDPAHARALAALEADSLPHVTSNAVFWETLTLIRYRLGHALAMRFGEELMRHPRVEILWLTKADEQEAWRILRRHGDQRFSFTDCLSFALMRRLGCRRALTFDRDFRAMGFLTSPS